jgi:transcriptional regulator with XRE-family HTH domain
MTLKVKNQASTAKAFGTRLKWWREHRGHSQLALSGAAEISQRHLSFLESGRAEPSRDMVLRLCAVLDVPLRQQNALMLAAGFAPVWQESDLGAPELAQVNGALDYMLAQQEPYPAFVVDRRWNLLRANAGAGALVTFLLGAVPSGSVNLADALVAPDVLCPFIENWEEVAVHFLRSVNADAVADGTAETADLLRRLMAYPDVPPLSSIASLETPGPVVCFRFRKGDDRLSLFTTIATLGTPQDVTLQDIRVESFFPSDASSADMFRAWAGAAKPV